MAYVNLGQVIYPVGAIFASTSSTSPSNLFGGTWNQITGDACLMAGNGVQYLGSKKISVNQIPSHRHDVRCTNLSGNEVALVDWQTNAGPGQIWFAGCADRNAGASNRYQAWNTGGGRTICLTPTDATCGDVPRSGTLRACSASEGDALPSSKEEQHRGDSSCVIFKTSKSKLVQALKRYVHSQLDTSINPLVQPVLLISMADNGQLSQMVDSLDLKGLGMVLAERMNTNSLLRKCLAINTDLQEGLTQLHILAIVGLLNMSTKKTIMPLFILQAVMPHTTTFPHTEHAIVGIELPNNLIWEVF